MAAAFLNLRPGPGSRGKNSAKTRLRGKGGGNGRQTSPSKGQKTIRGSPSPLHPLFRRDYPYVTTYLPGSPYLYLADDECVYSRRIMGIMSCQVMVYSKTFRNLVCVILHTCMYCTDDTVYLCKYRYAQLHIHSLWESIATSQMAQALRIFMHPHPWTRKSAMRQSSSL